MAQCPKCKGSGSLLSHLNPHDANKVGAGMGMLRCDICAGQGVVHGASGVGGGQQLGGWTHGDSRRSISSSDFLVCWILAHLYRAVNVFVRTRVGDRLKLGHEQPSNLVLHFGYGQSSCASRNISDVCSKDNEVDILYRHWGDNAGIRRRDYLSDY